MARARRFRRVGAPAGGRRAVRLLRGAAHRQRPPGLSSRPEPGVQGRVPALSDDARAPGAPQGRLGLPRAAGGAGGGEAARHQVQGRHRALRRGGVQRPLPRVGAALHRRVEPAHRADRLLARHRRRLLHARRLLHRVGLVVAQAGLGQGAAVRGPQGGALLPALRHRALQPRGGAGLPRHRGPFGLRALSRPRPAGRLVPRLDHHARGPFSPTPPWPCTPT